MRIKIIRAKEWNWYKVGEEYVIKDSEKYKSIGVQVYRENNGNAPDVVGHGDYKTVE